MCTGVKKITSALNRRTVWFVLASVEKCAKLLPVIIVGFGHRVTQQGSKIKAGTHATCTETQFSSSVW